MIDQDGVIINSQYQTTQNIKPLIKELLAQDVAIVPNSDTPIQRLRNNIEGWLGFLPQTLIGEKGAVIEHQGLCGLVKNIYGIEVYLEKLQNLFTQQGATVYVGDSATWIQNKKIFKPNSQLLIIDSFRQQSIGVYFLTSDFLGKTHIDSTWSKDALKLINTLVLPEGLDSLDYNPKYGIAIANASGATKKDGFSLIKNLFTDAQFFMIGDQTADFIGDASVVQCAVNNASDEYKKVSSFVAKQNFTSGLAECLEWIKQYY